MSVPASLSMSSKAEAQRFGYSARMNMATTSATYSDAASNHTVRDAAKRWLREQEKRRNSSKYLVL